MGKGIKTKITDELEVVIIPNPDHEFLMETKEVAQSYGVSVEALRSCKHRHGDELYEGKHFVSAVAFCNARSKSEGYNDNLVQKQTLWTKRGIVRLGFFIKSERAKMIRDWAEDLILEQLEGGNAKQIIRALPEVPKRKHNRLTAERINDIMKYVCMIDDKSLRMIISEKINQQ